MQFERKLQLATDLYQMSMGNVYVEDGKQDEMAVFDVFIRNNPFSGGYTVAAGLEQVIEYIEGLAFEEEDVRLLKKNHPEFQINLSAICAILNLPESFTPCRRAQFFSPLSPLSGSRRRWYRLSWSRPPS